MWVRYRFMDTAVDGLSHGCISVLVTNWSCGYNVGFWIQRRSTLSACILMTNDSDAGNAGP